MTQYELITIEHEGSVCRLTIQREEQLNALNHQVIKELTEAILTLPPDTRVVVLAGAGEKAFVAGADIAAMKDMTPTQAHAFARAGQQLTLAIEGCSAVTIARVQGFALGGGCELAMACDLIIASEKAKFGQPEVNLGLLPGFGGTQRLVRRIGLPRALDMLCAGQGGAVNGTQAYAMGLVSRVVAPADLDNEIGKAIRAIKKCGPLAISETKRLARAACDMALPAGLEAEASAFAAAFAGPEAKEGLGAFLEKRSPRFSG